MYLIEDAPRGQRLVLREMFVDCDRDALLVRAELDGGAPAEASGHLISHRRNRNAPAQAHGA